MALVNTVLIAAASRYAAGFGSPPGVVIVDARRRGDKRARWSASLA
jgi:hypothetical protein